MPIILHSIKKYHYMQNPPTVICERLMTRTSSAIVTLVLFLFILSSCTHSNETQESITVSVIADGTKRILELPIGSTVQNALDKAEININDLDRVEPPTQTQLTDQVSIRLTRVHEDFEIEEVIIPFSRQTVRNETLPEGHILLIQPGVNGIQQITYRRVFEDEIELSHSIFKSITISEPQPEIVMVGVQTPFTTITISGLLAYLTSGNAWLMESTTGNRHPVVTTGDLDGRVFSLSPDRKWLLYTRGTVNEPSEEINTLWVIDISKKTSQPINLKVKNIINYAGWVPGSTMTIAYSTVEPRSVAPGWQANNDLHTISLNSNGVILKKTKVIEANSGGIYGWWGTYFAWSSDGEQLAFARPDCVGIVDFKKSELIPLIDLIPLQTRSDWAWVPGLGWSPDHSVLYTVSHLPLSGLTTDEVSPIFDLTSFVFEEEIIINIISQSGMFAYPVPSPYTQDNRFYIAYLQAIFPEQSESSRYRLMIMDRDGSNRNSIFPPEGSPGIDPQLKMVVWGPDTGNIDSLWLALIYQGNLWLLNPGSGQAKQITGDGSIGRIDWK